MKLKRVIKLPKKDETLTLEMDADHDNFVHHVDLMEKRAEEVYAYFKGEIKVPKSPPKNQTRRTFMLLISQKGTRTSTFLICELTT